MVRQFTDEELLHRVQQLPSYRGMPEQLLIGVRSKADTFNEYDDKFYFYVNGKFLTMCTGTTNPGDKSLLSFTNGKGSAILKSDEIYYDCYAYGLHKQKMPALRQVRPMKYYRDKNKDKRVDEVGTVYEENAYTNFHLNNYDLLDRVKRMFIGGWSEGCQVSNDSLGYNVIINHVRLSGKPVTYALLKEF